MTKENNPLNGEVDTKDASDGRIAGCEKIESSPDDGSLVIIPKEGMLSSAMLDVSDSSVQITALPVLNDTDIKTKKSAWVKQARERRARLLKSRANSTR